MKKIAIASAIVTALITVAGVITIAVHFTWPAALITGGFAILTILNIEEAREAKD